MQRHRYTYTLAHLGDGTGAMRPVSNSCTSSRIAAGALATTGEGWRTNSSWNPAQYEWYGSLHDGQITSKSSSPHEPHTKHAYRDHHERKETYKHHTS
jgi:hypothetical protein